MNIQMIQHLTHAQNSANSNILESINRDEYSPENEDLQFVSDLEGRAGSFGGGLQEDSFEDSLRFDDEQFSADFDMTSEIDWDLIEAEWMRIESGMLIW